MRNIFHIKQNYEFYLGTPEILELEKRRGTLRVICDYVDIPNHQDKISSVLNVDIQNGKELILETDTYSLSEHAKENLKIELADDYLIYETCKKVAVELGFGAK